MEYRSVADLNRLVLQWTRSLPGDIDLVVGIPRSGMLAANMLALHLHLPLTDVQGLCAGRLMASGQRHAGGRDLAGKRKVLVVDDSICSGDALDEAKSRIEAAALPHEVQYGAVIASPEAVRAGKISLFAEAVPMPRIFEWNIMHAPSLSRACIQLEGVLCPDGDSGAPVWPSYQVGWIVSSRPESRRSETERWLRDQGIGYGKLLMGCSDLAEAYRTLQPEVLVMHGAAEASDVASRSGGPVFSTESRSMAYPGHYPRYLHVPVRPPHPAFRALRWLAYLPVRIVNKFSRTLFGRPIIPLRDRDMSHLKYAVSHYRLR